GEDAALQLSARCHRLWHGCLSKLVGWSVGSVCRRASVASRLARVARVESGRDRRHRTRAQTTRRSLAAAAGTVALRSRASAATVRGGRSGTSSRGTRTGTSLGRILACGRTVAERLCPLPTRLPDGAYDARTPTDCCVVPRPAGAVARQDNYSR